MVDQPRADVGPDPPPRVPPSYGENPEPVYRTHLPVQFVRSATARRIQRALTIALLVGTAVMLFAWTQKGRFVDAEDVDSRLLQEPVQTETERPDFSFAYEAEMYNVRPVADYELWGLVVSHNDIDGLGDIYHDEESVDTKDLCVIWGPNLQSNDFHKVDFSSGSFTCFWEYRGQLTFDNRAVSNNHLITADEEIREQIESVRIGDQVRFRGSLVNYQAASHPEFWRESSTTRDDDWGGACEVVYVDEIEILARGTPVWYLIYSICLWVVGLVVAGKLGYSIWEHAGPAWGRRTRA